MCRCMLQFSVFIFFCFDKEFKKFDLKSEKDVKICFENYNNDDDDDQIDIEFHENMG